MIAHLSSWLSALLVAGTFALVGWAVGGVTVAGAVAGMVIAFLLFYGIGPGAFAVLVAVFAVTWATTRLGRARKQRLGIAERRRGRRNARQVLANLAVSGSCAAVALAVHSAWPVAAAMAALAEAAADTSSSECGEAWSDKAYLIPRLCPVPAGTDGAITFAGTLAGVAGAGMVATLTGALHILPECGAAVVGAAGVLGMVLDTVLGAAVERRGRLGNDGVNFSSTLAAAAVAVILLAVIC